MKTAGQARPAYFLYSSFWSILDWLFPPICPGCGQLGLRWCNNCQSQVAQITGPVCIHCGEPEPHNGDVCRDCAAQILDYQMLRSYALFQGPLREAMHQLKYKRDVGIGEALSKHLITYYNDLKWAIDLVTAVPLSPQRFKERGYNQAGLLAKPLAYAIHKPYKPEVLLRLRNTRTQVGLSALERQQNMQDAFTAKEKAVRGKTVLIVDDVMTTGSTINACARALHKAGASAVYGLTLARAVLQADVDDQPT